MVVDAASLLETKPWVLSRPKSVRGERQYPISILRRRQVVLLKKLRVRGNVRSELGCSSCELQSEQFVDFKFLASREMRNDVLGKLIVPLRGSRHPIVVDASFDDRLRPPPASCDEHRDDISKRHVTTNPDGSGTNAPPNVPARHFPNIAMDDSSEERCKQSPGA